jgi:GT2 family glycosyltransferase
MSSREPRVVPASPSSPDGDDWPLVTIAILAYNRREPLKHTLHVMLEEIEYPRDALEVIVVDNDSTDGTSDMLSADFPDVQVIKTEKNIGAPAWNRALAAGAGEFFLILDDDCHLEGGDLKRAVAAARANTADLVSFRVRSGVDRSYFFNDEYATGLLSYWGCAALLSRRAVERLGGYDPNIFIWGNELELTLRLLDEGLRHLSMPEVVAVHMKLGREPRTYAEWGYRMHHRHMAYVGARFLRWADLLPVLGFRLAQVGIDVFALDRRVITVLPSIAAGVRDGLRARRPARPEISRLYRTAFPDFTSPFGTLRGPRERLAARRHPDRAEQDRLVKQRDFFAPRQRYFPEEATVLEV